MGVRNTKYVMYGVEVPFDEYLEVSKARGDGAEYDEYFDKYGLEYNKDAPYGFIDDGMSGQYAIFGAVLDRFDDDYGEQMPSGIIDLKKIFKPYRLTIKRKAEIKAGVEKLLGHEVKLKKLFVNHYS